MKHFTITLNEEQLALLEMVCDRYPRLICGQLDASLRDVCEDAWEKRNGGSQSIGTLEWYEMRHSLESTLKDLRKDYWGLTGGTYNGVRYNRTADTIWDMYQVMRYARYCAMPEGQRETLRATVMANTPMRFGEEELIQIEVK